MTPAKFRLLVWAHYRKHGRHDLPWRPPSLKLGKGREDDALYRVLVSEMMLQQTQVERVIPFYKKFLKKFPTSARLASSSLASVFQTWQGLGYNRRAKMLREAARELASRDIRTVPELEALPGVGPYTARAIAAFAWNENVVCIETNIRTAIIHHFFPRRRSVADTELVEVLSRALPKGRAREWYSALMDYGAYLKRSGVSHNARSRTYVKQSRFSGSLREARGTILRELSRGARAEARLADLFGASRRAQVRRALKNLLAEHLIQKRGGTFSLPR